MWNYVRYSGTGLLILACLFVYLQLHWVALGTFVAVGLVDIVLVIAKEKTISQWIHRQFPQWGDSLIMIALGGLTWWVWGVAAFLPVLMGIIFGHLFWHED